MVAKSKDGKGIYISCRCGCGDAVELEINDEDPNMYFYQSHLNGSFYRDQCGGFRTIREKIRKIWRIIRNKDYCYSEICLSKEEFGIFKQYINQF